VNRCVGAALKRCVSSAGLQAALLAVSVLTACGGNDTSAPANQDQDRASRFEAAQSQSATFSPTVIAGSEHACALTAAAGLQCWGNNSSGQLGNGSTAPTSGPVAAVGIADSIVAASAGGNRTCVLTSAGAVKCWGAGYLGDGSSTSSTTPVDVVGLSQGVKQISVGTSHSCAVTHAGGVQCWGSNDQGQVGVSGSTVQPLPVDVQGLASGVRKVSAGQSHTCALMESGTVKCWGSNLGGQLGNGSLIGMTSTPMEVASLGEAAQDIDGAHRHICVALASGGVKCWGDNGTWQLGAGGIFDSRTPVAVSGVAGAVSIHTGSTHTCARTGGGTARCWGNNSLGQLGDPSALADWYVRADPVGLSPRVRALAAGSFFNCAMLQSDAGPQYVRCWGENERGQVGVPMMNQVLVPVQLPSLYNVSSLDAGGAHACAIMGDGRVQCWGNNASGQLGDGTAIGRYATADVQGLNGGVRSISAGRNHTCATNASSGGLQCWGANSFGQLGDGTRQDRALPVDVTGFAGGLLGGAVSAGYVHTCGVTGSGAAQCWGYNLPWALGDGTSIDRAAPADVFGLTSGVMSVGAEGTRGCAIVSGGEVRCWGWEYGSSVPIALSGFGGPVWSLSIGERHECALTAAGAVRCWGAGILGDGNPAVPGSRVQVPVQVSGLEAGALSVAVGADHACAVTQAGAVVCWGVNTSGALGDGTQVDRLTPVPVSGIASGAVSVTAGDGYTCALMNNASVKCWGRNFSGQVGVNPNVHVRVPIDVQGLDLGDTAPPVATPTFSGTMGAAGWSRTDVTVNWNWSDWGLGIDPAACTSTSVSAGEGAWLVVSATCADLAGNLGSESRAVKVDKTAPDVSITSGPSGTVTSTAATFAFTASDALSGVAGAQCSLDGAAFAPCTSPANYVGLGLGSHTLTVRAIDIAGNVNAVGTTRTWTVADSTAPSITPAVTGLLGNNGWYRGAVSVVWNVVDAESSIISQSGCGSQSITSNTAGITFTCTATSGGGSASASVTVRIDATAPALGASVSPTTVLQYLPVTVTATGAADGLSGLAGTSCAVPITTVPGARISTCTATDNAGNTATATAGYTVITASAAITNLINRVKSLRLDKASERSLVSELTLAQGDLAAGRKTSALTNMQDFVNLVNGMRGRKINTANADALSADAQTIIRSIQASP
jgi:alpha-tubulin suppressor-like RCC1 family protein